MTQKTFKASLIGFDPVAVKNVLQLEHLEHETNTHGETVYTFTDHQDLVDFLMAYPQAVKL